MMRLLLLLWCSAVLLAVARGEVVERAYYLGTKEPLLWAYEIAHKDPSKEEDLFGAEPELVRLKGVPYESLYLSKGDELWDVSAVFAEDSGKRRLFERAIFNETTGRFVFKGEREVSDRVDAIARAQIMDLPRTIQINAKVYRVKKKNFGVSKWNGGELEKRHKSLLEAEGMTRPGQQFVFKGGAIEMRVQPQVGGNDEVIDLEFYDQRRG